MVIAKFSRDSIDMSNAHCGDCLAGATESKYDVCVHALYRCYHPLTLLNSGRDTPTYLPQSYEERCPGIII